MANGRDWHADDLAKLRRLVAAGWTDGQIGEEMDRHRDDVGRKRRALELAPGQSATFTAMMARINYRRVARA